MIIERLGDGLKDVKLSGKQEIEMSKKMSRLASESRQDCKLNSCYYCKKPTTNFCNSHSIPRFCLENIGINGEVTGPNSIFKFPYMGIQFSKEHIGINASGTFQIICRECDSKIFQDYENPDNYIPNKQPNQKILAQIAIKNYLKFISKRLFEISTYKKISNEKGTSNPYFDIKNLASQNTSYLDLDNYQSDYKYACRIARTGDNGYYIIYYRVLDYVTPIAIQAPISLAVDLDDNIVNNILNMDKKYNISDLHLCVFPLETKTAVIMFIKNGDIRYRKFYKRFRELNECEKLSIINYMIFLYCEDYYLSRNIEEIVDLGAFEIAIKTPTVWGFTSEKDKIRNLSEEYSLKNHKAIPNLLSEEYKLR